MLLTVFFNTFIPYKAYKLPKIVGACTRPCNHWFYI